MDLESWLGSPAPFLETLEEHLLCGICKEFFRVPVLTNCGHMFCSLCIQRHQLNKSKCPHCRVTLKHKHLVVAQMTDLVHAYSQGRPLLVKALVQVVDTDPPPTSDSSTISWQSSSAPFLAGFEELLECRVCDNLLSEPVVTSCGHLIDQSCLGSDRTQCPRCDTALRQTCQKAEVLQRLVDDYSRYRSALFALLYKPKSRKRKAEEQDIEQDVEQDIEQVPSDQTSGACPVCSKLFPLKHLPVHVDECLDGGRSSRSKAKAFASLARPVASATKKKLATVAYDLCTDPKLRALLKEQGLPTTGPRELIQRRHAEWVALWNSNIDSKVPVSRKALLKSLEEVDKYYQKTATNENFDKESWKKSNAQSYKDLVQQAREARMKKQQS